MVRTSDRVFVFLFIVASLAGSVLASIVASDVAGDSRVGWLVFLTAGFILNTVAFAIIASDIQRKGG